MTITLEKNAIILRPKNHSINLKPLLYFIDNNFQKVKYFSDSVVIFNEGSEEIKKKYLLKWAYKIYEKSLPYTNELFLKRLIASYSLPIQVITSNNNSMNHSLTQMATITIDQISSHEICVSCSQHQEKLTQYFKLIFKDVMVQNSQKSTFNITIATKAHLGILKNILSRKEIMNIPITFVAHGLSFKRMHPEDTYSAEYLYKEKLQKSYIILSISDTSTAGEMKKNYRNMLKKYHPDTVYNQNDDVVQLYTRRFQVIQNAYEFVKEHHKIA